MILPTGACASKPTACPLRRSFFGPWLKLRVSKARTDVEHSASMDATPDFLIKLRSIMMCEDPTIIAWERGAWPRFGARKGHLSAGATM